MVVPLALLPTIETPVNAELRVLGRVEPAAGAAGAFGPVVRQGSAVELDLVLVAEDRATDPAPVAGTGTRGVVVDVDVRQRGRGVVVVDPAAVTFPRPVSRGVVRERATRHLEHAVLVVDGAAVAVVAGGGRVLGERRVLDRDVRPVLVDGSAVLRVVARERRVRDVDGVVLKGVEGAALLAGRVVVRPDVVQDEGAGLVVGELHGTAEVGLPVAEPERAQEQRRRAAVAVGGARRTGRIRHRRRRSSRRPCRPPRRPGSR